MTERAVPCGGCTACCHDDLIMLHPESGDRADLYATMPAVSPVTGRPGLALRRAPDGACIYLDRRAGCTIHATRPAVCRAFDCRLVWLKLGAARARKFVARGVLGQAVVEAGRARRHTLDGARGGSHG